MSNVVFEIFSEELPATLQKKIVADFSYFSKKELKKLDIKFSDNDVFTGITLNRLVLEVKNCEISQQQLVELIKTTLKDFSKTFPRTMCYPQLELRWLRPIRNIFACIDDKVISENFFGIETKNGTFINKFDYKTCNLVEEYEDIIKQSNIVLDYSKRVSFVSEQIAKIQQENGDNDVYNNKSLINEIAGMSEYCIEPMVCVLDEKFSILLFELIELVLRENQRYVVFKPNQNGEIIFLIFGDKNTDIVKAGHMKVVSARLDDALFYWQQDENIKTNKNALQQELFARTFIDDIYWKDYLEKQMQMADVLLANDEELLPKVKQLILDTKLDLATGVVAEFPELQGIIGGYYFGYKFNPYKLDIETLKNVTQDVLYYYLIDRVVYIDVMYQQGKQPTGSGDKYKVKARMDDIIEVMFYLQVDVETIKNICFVNDDVFALYKKRLQKIVEDKILKTISDDGENNVKIDVKKFANVCIKLLDKNVFCRDVNLWFLKAQDEFFVKTYKRIYGYTKNILFAKTDDDAVKEKVNEIFANNDLAILNSYLDENKISDDEITKQALKVIENNFFASNLPSEFLEML